MPTVPEADRLPLVDSVPVSERTVALPPPSETSALMFSMAMPDRESTSRAPDARSEPPIAGEASAPRTCRETSAAPLSDRPCAASRRVRKANGTEPETSTESDRDRVSTVPPPCSPAPAPSAALASKVSRPPAKSPLEFMRIAPKPAERVWAVSAPVQSIE